MRGHSLLLAVSGGADSMALLHGAHRLRGSYRLQLLVAHIDHSLRDGSAADASFVTSRCKKLSIPCEVVRLKNAPRTNIEAWARGERYRALEILRAARGCDLILTAHTANDVAETLLMKLFSNKELSSILERDPRRHLLRPFLRVTRSRIEGFLNSRAADWIEDPSNQSPRFLRNRVRNKILPVIREEFGDSTVESLALAARRLHLDLELLRALSGQHLQRINHLEFGSREWFRTLQAELLEVPHAIKIRLIEQLFAPHLPVAPGRAQSERILTFIEGGRAAQELSGGVRLFRSGGGLRVELRKG